MRDVMKIKKDINILIQRHGEKNVFWDREYKWIGMMNWGLPGKMNKKECRLVVLLPENYGNGAPVIDSFLEPGLEVYNPSVKIFQGLDQSKHYFSEYKHNPNDLTFGTAKEWCANGWWWLCLQDRQHTASMSSVLNYLTHVYKFLNEPFKDWSKYFKAYGEGAG